MVVAKPNDDRNEYKQNFSRLSRNYKLNEKYSKDRVASKSFHVKFKMMLHLTV